MRQNVYIRGKGFKNIYVGKSKTMELIRDLIFEVIIKLTPTDRSKREGMSRLLISKPFDILEYFDFR